MVRSDRYSKGFTIVEIIIVLAILTIVLGISWQVTNSYMAYARDNERESDTKSISRVFERFYRSQSASTGTPTYPTVTQINNSAQRSLIIPNGDERLIAPNNAGSVSLIAATTTATPAPTAQQYIYQPFTSSGAICTNGASAPCVRFFLYSRSEASDQVIVLESMHQQ